MGRDGKRTLRGLAADDSAVMRGVLRTLLELHASQGVAAELLPQAAELDAQAVEVVVIGVSTGGPAALEVMLPMLPVDLTVPVLIVQHMPKLFTAALAQRLDGMCALRVKQAWNGAPVEPGTVWLAPGGAHMEVAAGMRGRRTIRLHRGPMLHGCMPSVDYLFRSASQVYGGGVLAVVMTGMGSDGLEGAREVRSAGGSVLVQDQASSAVWGMPGRVAGAGLQTATVGLAKMAGALMDRIGAGSRPLQLAESRREVLYGVL